MIFWGGQRKAAIRIKPMVTDGMRFSCADAEKSLYLGRFTLRITCNVSTQNGCTKLKKCLGHLSYWGYSPSDWQNGNIVYTDQEREMKMLGVKGISTLS